MLVAHACIYSTKGQCMAILGKARGILLADDAIGRREVILWVPIDILTIGIGIFATRREASTPYGIGKHELACPHTIIHLVIGVYNAAFIHRAHLIVSVVPILILHQQVGIKIDIQFAYSTVIICVELMIVEVIVEHG